ncbi:phosphatase PAP2 family protein [Teredinibacter waterburyi]|uniref:phosphatase PAP2 family protein n=1 Tax=Teredinibacter waterburyi TaxID=1500538 RepID=UPI001FE2FF9D|nr:phosphatase PAP2 family protein [Teredinibacter waterburyi]
MSTRNQGQPTLKSNWYEQRLAFLWRADLLACLGCVAFFLLLPKLDLWTSALFFDGSGFPLDRNSVVQFIYHAFAKIQIVYLLAIIGGIAWCSYRGLKAARKAWLFLLAALILGPGLIVNVGLKENSVGRPRPRDVQPFAGEHSFAPVFTYSGACQRNCSFVSGHAAISFYLMSLAWALGRRRWLSLGIGAGIIVGFVRIVQGGHFLSDVIFSGWVVYFTCVILAHFMGLSLERQKTTLSEAEKH